MPRKGTAHSELDDLRQAAVAERRKQRDLDLSLEAAKSEVEEASRAVTDAYAAEDEKLAQQRRKDLQEAEAKVVDLQHRRNAVALRVERAERKAGDFEREHAKQLLADLEPEAIAIAKDSNQWAAQAMELKQRWTAHQKRTDELVALVPGASPRADCPSTEHSLGSAFKELEGREEVQPYMPNWSGVNQRSRTDKVHRLIRLKRQKASESEIEQLRHELTPKGAA